MKLKTCLQFDEPAPTELDGQVTVLQVDYLSKFSLIRKFATVWVTL